MRSRVASLALLVLFTALPGIAENIPTIGDLSFVRSSAARETPAAKAALEAANKALNAGPWSVMDKPLTAPSGDKHDYFSVPPYWWPNPNTPNGLPYVRRDGVVNPDRDKYDNVGLNDMSDAVKTLALAWAVSDDPKYAERAALVLRTWFLDPATRMNPNLNFAQGVPGISSGRPEGIIDTANWPHLLDAVALLDSAPAFDDALMNELRAWFSAYLDWLLESPIGIGEARARNNHGTCYDLQVARFAAFTGRDALARDVLAQVGPKRIEVQIESDGSQPLELSRTKSFGYSLKNLEALMDLAALARQYGVDLWAYKGAKAQGIRTAFQFVLDHSLGGQAWPGENIAGMDLGRFLPLLHRGCQLWDSPDYRTRLESQFGTNAEASAFQLWHGPVTKIVTPFPSTEQK